MPRMSGRTLWTRLRLHRCGGNSGTRTKGSDRPSGEEIALPLIGWLGAAGAQISRFQEESGLVKWIGTVCALCVLFVIVCAPFVLCLGFGAYSCVYMWESVCLYACGCAQKSGEAGKIRKGKEQSRRRGVVRIGVCLRVYLMIDGRIRREAEGTVNKRKEMAIIWKEKQKEWKECGKSGTGGWTKNRGYFSQLGTHDNWGTECVCVRLHY